jgi:hypothetical protein
MSDLLRQGSQWLEQQRTAHMTSPVTYRRAGQADAEVLATWGKTDLEVADDYGATIRTHVIDFLILADALWQEGFEPQAGDVIVAPSTGSGQATGRKFEVMDLAGQGCWRWSDPYRTTFRIHTKDTGPDA